MTVLFDTLKLAERLEAAGMPPQQARETSAAFAETFTEAVATRADIASLREHIDRSIAELRAEIAALDASLRAEMRSLETRLLAAMDRRDLNLTVRMLGIVAALNGLLFALLKLT